MPDNKTVYATDDGKNTAFYKYIANKPGNLTAGTLYAAKVKQVNNENCGEFEFLAWVKLGSATDA